MKKFNVLLVVALLAVNTAFATGTEPTSDKKEKTVTQQVATLLEKPEFEVTQELTAQVTLVVNEENEVVVISVDTNQEYLADFIKSRLNYETLDTTTIGTQFKLPVRIVPADE